MSFECEVSIDIEAPAPDVYSYLADFPRHSEWSSARMTYLKQMTPGPIRVGSEFEAAETVPAKVVTRSRVTALERDRRIAWHAWLGNVTAFDWEFVLTDRDGTTHLVQRCAAQAPVWVRILFWPLVQLRYRQIPVENLQSLERIKAALERKVSVS